jgi:hypothetical protein
MQNYLDSKNDARFNKYETDDFIDAINDSTFNNYETDDFNGARNDFTYDNDETHDFKNVATFESDETNNFNDAKNDATFDKGETFQSSYPNNDLNEESDFFETGETPSHIYGYYDDDEAENERSKSVYENLSKKSEFDYELQNVEDGFASRKSLTKNVQNFESTKNGFISPPFVDNREHEPAENFDEQVFSIF